MITPAVRAALRRSLIADDRNDDALLSWLAERRAATPGEIELVEIDRLRSWSLTPDRRRIVHDSGRFFSILGLAVELERGSVREQISQPLIDQPEVGLLGLLVRIVDGRAELLVQAKLEPGDPDGAQLAPTVQATQSNFARVHGGTAPPGLAEFVGSGRGTILFDAALPEQAELFLAKRNRNVITLLDDAPAIAPEFRWATLAELGRALARADTVNMSLRSLLACVAALALEAEENSPTCGQTGAQTRAWLAEIDARWSRRASERALDRLPGWRLEPSGLVPEHPHTCGGLRVVYVDVHAPTREVLRWTQPMLARSQLGCIALHVHRDGNETQLLLEPTLGIGQADGVRLSVARGDAPRGELRFEATLAEDGGRLLAIRNRYRVIEHARAFEPPTPARWISLRELPTLLATGTLDIEARTCVAAMLLGSAPDQLAAPA